MTAHALISPSSMAMFIKCKPAVFYNALYPNQPNKFTEEGTEAHQVLEELIHYYQGKNVVKPTANEDMLFYAEKTVEWLAPYSIDDIQTEVRLHVHDFKRVWGTADVVIFEEDAKELTIIDYKYGENLEVAVKDNPQLMTYLTLAAIKLVGKDNLKEFRYSFGVAQPRLDKYLILPVDVKHVKKHIEVLTTLDREVDRLAPFIETIEDVEKVAGTGNAKGLRHCRYCKHQSNCLAYYNENASTINELLSIQPDTDVELLGRLLELEKDVKAAFATIRDKIKSLTLLGYDTGYKVVDGRAPRKWKGDVEDIEYELIALGVKNPIEKKPIGITKVFEQLGKSEAVKAAIDKLTVREEAKQKLVKL